MFESVYYGVVPINHSQVAISQKRIPIYLAMGIQAQLAANAGRFATKRSRSRLKTAIFPLLSHLTRELQDAFRLICNPRSVSIYLSLHIPADQRCSPCSLSREKPQISLKNDAFYGLAGSASLHFRRISLLFARCRERPVRGGLHPPPRSRAF